MTGAPPDPEGFVNPITDRNTVRRIDRHLAQYSDACRDPLNQAIRAIAVPAILWSMVALLWCIPVPGTLARTGIWAALAMFFAWSYCYRLSRPLGLGMLAVFFVFGCLCRLLEMRLGLTTLLWTAMAVWVAGLIALLAGFRIEGRRPGRLTGPAGLLVGPLWVLASLYRRMGWSY